MDKKYSVQEVAKLMMETETENENSDASDLEEFCDSTSESGSSSVLSDSCDVMKMMVMAVGRSGPGM